MLCHPGNHLNSVNNIVPTLITAIVFFTVYFSFSGLVVKHMVFLYIVYFFIAVLVWECLQIFIVMAMGMIAVII